MDFILGNPASSANCEQVFYSHVTGKHCRDSQTTYLCPIRIYGSVGVAKISDNIKTETSLTLYVTYTSDRKIKVQYMRGVLQSHLLCHSDEFSVVMVIVLSVQCLTNALINNVRYNITIRYNVGLYTVYGYIINTIYLFRQQFDKNRTKSAQVQLW